MPSIADSAVIFILALMLFGPKKLPQLARQLGKLMAEFRRASNEFRMQMEDELRIEDQKEHQKKVDAMAGPPSTLPEPEHPHLPHLEATTDDTTGENSGGETAVEPIAESGGLRMMPPSTGLPVQSAYGNAPEPVIIDGVEYPAAVEHEVAEHTIHNPEPGVGTGSEEPVSEQTHA
jgi:sec-independent protein translocase protein TatB